MMKHCKMVKKGYYRIEVNKTIYELPARYESIVHVHCGVYAQVCSAFDKETERIVAIKKLARPFQSALHAKRAYREVRILKQMKHENIINLLDLFTPGTSADSCDDIYLVTPYMRADLHNIMKMQSLSDDQIQFLVYQILRGLKYIHSAGIIHRDMKPSNIAVNEDCELKILDFGLARHENDIMTGYVVTRWYRAPEITLNWMHYDKSVDIWSVGCIMAELITRKILFPCTDKIDHLTRILMLIGTPDGEFLKKINSDDARRFIKTLPVMEKLDFSTVFIGANPLAIDLLEKMLDLDPDSRITVDEALAHGYLHQWADLSDEPQADPYDQSFEDEELECRDWQKLVWNECDTFGPPSPEDVI